MYGSRWESLKHSLLETSKPIEYSKNLTKSYFLDEASVLVASLLPIQPKDDVLDMCAAPGGKTLVLATSLGKSGTLTANDRSSSRRARLHRVLNDHLHEEHRMLVKVTSHDATKWSLYETDAYDAILLDAPCSSERHVIQDPKALSQWSPSRTKRLAQQQFAMLVAALDAVRVGGHILYSTCSISVHENQEVIKKLHTRRPGRFFEVEFDLPYSEALEHGSMILPDTSDNRGPLYASLLRRIS